MENGEQERMSKRTTLDDGIDDLMEQVQAQIDDAKRRGVRAKYDREKSELGRASDDSGTLLRPARGIVARVKELLRPTKK